MYLYLGSLRRIDCHNGRVKVPVSRKHRALQAGKCQYGLAKSFVLQILYDSSALCNFCLFF